MTDLVTQDLNAYGFSTEIRVRLSETDAVGIVFFGSFSTYFDVGRMDYLNNIGLQRFEGTIRGLPPGAVVAKSARFYAPARYNDRLILHVRLARIGRTSYSFHFLIIHKQKRHCIATGTLTLVWMNDDFVPIRVPQAFRDAVAAFEGDRLIQATRTE